MTEKCVKYADKGILRIFLQREIHKPKYAFLCKYKCINELKYKAQTKIIQYVIDFKRHNAQGKCRF